MTRLTIGLLLLSACSPIKTGGLDTAGPAQADTDADADADDTSTPDAPSTLPSGLITFHEGRVFDPKLEGGLIQFNAALSGDDSACSVSLGASNGIGQQWTADEPLGSLSWDGLDDAGLFFDPGPTSLAITADCGDGEAVLFATEIAIVRLGIAAVNFQDDGDSTGNVALAFHKQNLFEAHVSPVGDRPEYHRGTAGALGGELDTDAGTPRPTVPTWADPDVPPWADGARDQHNVPAAYIAGHPVGATITLGAHAVSQARHILVNAWGPSPDAIPPIRLLLDGTVVSEDLIHPGEPVSLSLDEASETMGKEIRHLVWTFEAADGEDWTPIPGAIETTHTLYTLAGEPALLDGRDVGKAPPIPWIGVLEDTATIMEGVEATTPAVLDALRDYLFEHEYIIYDPGVGAYTDFEGPYIYWTSITAQISSFLDRRSGLSLYCHSMSCTLSALAGNHGVFAEQLVLGVYFYTNLTRAAGTSGWQRWSFNSHSVVSPDEGETIWDSSIALDGDETPSTLPVDEIMPKGMDREEYFWRLTYDEIDIVNQGLCYIE